MMARFRTIGQGWRDASRLRAVLPIMIAVWIIGTGNSLLTVTISLYLSRIDAGADAIRAVLTAFPVGFLIGCLAARRLIARIGHEKAFLLTTSLGLAASMVFLATTAMEAWFVLRFLNGFSIAVMFVVCESWINLYAEEKRRGRYFSVYMLMTALAVVFGQLLVEVAGPRSPYLILLSVGTITVGLAYSRFVGGRWPTLPAAPAAVAELPELAPSEKRYGLRELVRLAPVTVVSIFQAGITNTNVFVMTPIYGAQVGLDPAVTVGLITAFSLGGMLGQAPIGWLSDHFDRRYMLLAQGILVAALCTAIGWLGNRQPALLYFLFFAYGLIALTIYPVAIAVANSRIESRHMVSASGALLLLYSLGNVLTPGVSAGLMELGAPWALFALLGGGAALVAVAALFNMLRAPFEPRIAYADCAPGVEK
jgi:MFS family permease